MSKKVVVNSIYYTLGKMLPMAVAFIMVPIYTSYLLPEDYGIVNSMKVLISVFTVIFSLSIDASLFRLYYDYTDEEKRQKFLGTAFFLIILSTTIGTIILFAFSAYVEKIFREIPFSPFYVMTFVAMYLGIYAIVPRIILVIIEKGKLYFYIGLVQLIIALILNVIYIIILEEKAIGVLKALFLTNLIMLPIYMFIQFKYSRISFDFSIVKNILYFSIPLLPAAMSGWIMNESNRIFIDQYFSQSEVGIYSLGYRITFVFIVVITSIRLAYNPLYFRLANSDSQDMAQSRLFRYNHFYFILAILGTFMLSFFARELIGLFLNKNYYDAWIILAILTYANLFLESSAIFRMSLYQKKVTGVITFIVIVIALINLLLNWILISKWNIIGAGASTLICGMLLFFAFYLASRKYGYYINVKWTILAVLVFISLIINIIFWLIPVSLCTSLILKIVFTGIILSGLFLKYHDEISSFSTQLFQK
jgi:O-antigen/teichoic acid export membrane protein